MGGYVKWALIFLSTSLTLCAIASAQFPVYTVIIAGRVKNASPHSTVHVELVYPKRKPGEAGEVTVENATFRIPLEFVTMQSSIFTDLPPRCGRKPKTVEITLMQNDHEADRAYLDFDKSFRMTDASAYTLRSELLLNGSQ